MFDIYGQLNIADDQIRLLTLHPRNNSDACISCELSAVSLASNPRYEALSYCWGSPSNPRPILLNTTTFEVRENLYTALEHLQDYTRPRTLWIDAICINQGDVAERSQQVRKMTDIYGRAIQVVAWIGESTEASFTAFNFLQGIHGLLNRSLDMGEKTSQLLEARSTLLQRLRADVQAKAACRALFTEILQRPYWNRMWIIQEIAVASDVVLQCGDLIMHWDQFVAGAMNLMWALTELGENPGTTSGGGACMATINSIRQLRRRGIRIPLGDLIAASRAARATDPRDMAYALLGLAKKTPLSDHLMDPDYERSPEDVCTRVVQHHIETELNLDIICMSMGYRPGSTTPSWVPDWPKLWEAVGPRVPFSERAPILPLIPRFTSGEVLARAYTPQEDSIASLDLLPLGEEWNASQGIPAVASIIRNPDRLVARGVCIDSIKNVGEIVSIHEPDLSFQAWEELAAHRFGVFQHTISHAGGNTILQVSDQANELCAKWEEHKGVDVPGMIGRRTRRFFRTWGMSYKCGGAGELEYVGGGIMLQAFVSTILAGRLLDMSRFDDDDYRAFWTGSVPGLPKAANAHRMLMLAKSLRMASIHHRLVISKRGYFCRTTSNVRRGDKICILFGCSVPVVLRSEADHYVFVGETYMHGAMDGELMRGFRTRNYLEEEFLLH